MKIDKCNRRDKKVERRKTRVKKDNRDETRKKKQESINRRKQEELKEKMENYSIDVIVDSVYVEDYFRKGEKNV